MSAKELFQADKELAAWWANITHNERMQRVILHVRSELMDLELTPEATRGARMFEHLLTTIAEGEDRMPILPSGPGLNHDLESDLRRPPPPVKPPPRTKTKK